MQYQLVSFDLDGTLVDTAAEIAEAVNRALDDHGIGRRPVPEITELIGAGTRDLMVRLLARRLVEAPWLEEVARRDRVLQSLDRHYALTAGTSAMPYAGCRQALEQLRLAGVRLVCVTNKEYAHARRVLQATRLSDYFELLIGGDTLPARKPDPTVMQHVLQCFDVAPARAAHLGDSAIDVTTARNAGIAAWTVPYGYNGGVPVAESRPDLMFEGLMQVATHVLAHAGNGT